MTTTEMREYLEAYVASQGTQVGLGVAPLLESIIDALEGAADASKTASVFVVELEDTVETTKAVTNEQDDIDAFIDAANEAPGLNVPVAHDAGAVITFAQLEVTDDTVNGSLDIGGGHYALTLSKTPGASQLTYIANEIA